MAEKGEALAREINRFTMQPIKATTLRVQKALRGTRLFAKSLPGVGLRLLRGGLQGRVVQVENTNFCNFRCEYCVTHAPGSLVKAPRGHMSMATYEKILDKHESALMVVLQGDGEPLLDPTLFDKIAMAKSRGMFTQVISNGSMVRGAMVDRLLHEGPDVLLFSIDAVSPKRNMAQRAGLRYQNVVEGIAALTGGRTADSHRMLIGLLSIVHGQVDNEVRTALRSFNDLDIDLLLYKQLNPAFEGRIEGYQAPVASPVPWSLRRELNYPLWHQRIASIKPCPQLRWDMPYYLWDGRRTACCVLNDPSFTTPEFQRPALLKRYKEKALPKECENCSFFAGYST